MAWVLLVEDDAIDRMSVETTFRNLGMGAVLRTASDARDALHMIESTVAAGEPPAYIIIDIRLPGMSGLDLLYTIRARPALEGLPVAVYTGSQLAADRTAAESAGCDHFFVKPVDFATFEKEITTMSQMWL